MVYACAVVGCSNRNNRETHLSYFGIPSVIQNQCNKTLTLSTERRSKWLASIDRKDLCDKDVTKNTRVCGVHFHSGKSADLFDNTNPDWVPTVNMRPKINTAEASAKSAERYKRTKNRMTRKQEDVDIGMEEEMNENIEDPPEDLATVQQKLREMTVERDNLKTENEELKIRCAALQKKVEHLQKGTISQATLEENNHKVTFYTGLPTFTLLMKVFNLCKDFVPTSYRNALSPFQEFMIVMMRLRLHLLMEDLAYRFNISQPTVSRIITKWLEVMALRLKSLIVWPEQEVLQKTMPECFLKAFGKSVTIIIDCFELFIDAPTDLLGKCGTWSKYKHHNTVKFLIGITPQGTVSYISKAYVGRTPDTAITENCGILDQLKAGDVVLADRGFEVGNSVGVLRARVVQPAYLYGRAQLSSEEVDTTRQIAHVRIHVERVIGLVRRKYRILHEQMPLDSLKIKEGQALAPVDQIAIVCCALTNLCPPIVPMFEKEEHHWQ